MAARQMLVDTDILIDAGRGVDTAIVQLRDAAQTSVLVVSSITQMELMVGCRDRTEFRTVEQFLSRFEIVSLSEQISDRAIVLLRTYRLSHGLLIPDALIAATALVLSIPFVSKNQRDYRFIEHLNLLPYPKH